MVRIPDWSRYDVVSFDVFDTLVARLVAKPVDVFKIVEMRALGEGICARGFAEARVRAERDARADADSHDEVTLDQVYAFLGEHLGCDADLNRLQRLELAVELDVCVAKPAGKQLYDAALSSGSVIVITSDMYLPSVFLERILLSCGYSGWQRMFVSSEWGKTKAGGGLFGVVTHEMDVCPARMLHVGDNVKSDIVRARLAGLHAHHVHLETEPHGIDSSERDGLVASFISAAANIRQLSGSFLHGSPSFEDLGYSLLGPVLTGFCLWLSERLREDGIQKVFFLARDGLIIKRCCEALGLEFPEARYLYVSRRALQVPSFALMEDFQDVVASMFLPRKISLRKLYGKMGLDEREISTLLSDAGVDPDCVHDSATLFQNEQAIFSFGLLGDRVRENARRELRLLRRYLEQSGVNGSFAIVDIGWFGNMQLALERVLDCSSDTAVRGYYVGLHPDGANQRNHCMHGYLFDANHGRSLYRKERNYNLLFETLFSATHGTTRGYRMNGDQVEPVLAEYCGAEASVGYDAERMRMGALTFAKDWRRVFGLIEGIRISPSVALSELNRLGNEPTYRESCLFGGWAMEADGELVYAAKPDSLSSYLMCPRRLVRDFSRVSWKIGFLRRLFVVPLPYGRFWDWLHRCYEHRHPRCSD